MNTLLLMRVAVLLALDNASSGVPGYLHRSLDPILAPINGLPLLAAEITGACRLGDVLVAAVVFFGWLLVLGVMAGWYAEEQRGRGRSI